MFKVSIESDKSSATGRA